MTTKLKLTCDCGKELELGPIRKEFRSFSGRKHGFGQWHQPSIDDVVEPAGWQWSDPYTSCTYCPECWADIIKTEAAE